MIHKACNDDECEANHCPEYRKHTAGRTHSCESCQIAYEAEMDKGAS